MGRRGAGQGEGGIKRPVSRPHETGSDTANPGPTLQSAMLATALRQGNHCPFQARGERAYLDIRCREQDLWSLLLARLHACSPPL